MSFEKKMEKIEDSLSNLSSIASECGDLIGDVDNIYRTSFLISECNDISQLISEASEKLINIKHMLMADQILPHDTDYQLLTSQKLLEINKQTRFMEVFAPYMFMHVQYQQ